MFVELFFKFIPFTILQIYYLCSIETRTYYLSLFWYQFTKISSIVFNVKSDKFLACDIIFKLVRIMPRGVRNGDDICCENESVNKSLPSQWSYHH